MTLHEARGSGTPVGSSALTRRLWLATLVLGVLLWAAVAGAIALTNDTISCPT